MEFCPECGRKLEHITTIFEGYKGIIHIDIYICKKCNQVWVQELHTIDQSVKIYPSTMSIEEALALKH